MGEEKDDGRDDQGRRGQIGMHFEKITGMDWWRSEKYDDTDEDISENSLIDSIDFVNV